MPATELLCQIIGINTRKLTREENFFLEVELFSVVCEGLQKFFKVQYQNHFYLMNCNGKMEDLMTEADLVRCMINDILSTEEYTLLGIACYTQTPEEVVCDVIMGLNTSPSATFLRKVIELHRSIRRDLYSEILKKSQRNI